MIYKDQFTTDFKGFDLSYDGLTMGDRGHNREHLAPNLKSESHWFMAHSSEAMTQRIKVYENAIKRLNLVDN